MTPVDILLWLGVGIAAMVFIIMLITTIVFVTVFGIVVVVLFVGTILLIVKVRSETRVLTGADDDEPTADEYFEV